MGLFGKKAKAAPVPTEPLIHSSREIGKVADIVGHKRTTVQTSDQAIIQAVCGGLEDLGGPVERYALAKVEPDSKRINDKTAVKVSIGGLVVGYIAPGYDKRGVNSILRERGPFTCQAVFLGSDDLLRVVIELDR